MVTSSLRMEENPVGGKKESYDILKFLNFMDPFLIFAIVLHRSNHWRADICINYWGKYTFYNVICLLIPKVQGATSLGSPDIISSK
jgi:hypothetical protein